MSIDRDDPIIDQLKEKVDQRVVVTIHDETKAESLGNLQWGDPQTHNSTREIVLLGIYGFAECSGLAGPRLMYLHGRDLKTGQDVLLRNNREMMSDEVTGVTTFDSSTQIKSVDELDVSHILTSTIWGTDQELLAQRIAADTCNANSEYLIIALERGAPNYLPRSWHPNYSLFTRDSEPEFIDQVLKQSYLTLIRP